MTSTRVRNIIAGVALASLAALSGVAQAATVTGRFDPVFGATLGNAVGYRGSATFSISDACLSLGGVTGTSGGGFVYADYGCGGGPDAGMSFLGADIEFYDVGNPLDVLGTVHFAAATGGVLGMYLQNDQVTGFQTAVLGPATSVWTSSAPADLDFYLQFGVLGYDTLDPGEGAPVSPIPGDGDNDLDDFTADAFQLATMWQGGTSCTPGVSCSNQATVSAVPEPGSLALVGAALAAGCWLRRRRA